LDKKEILSFITTNNIGYLATVEGKSPRVRGMDTFRADENGLIFYTDKSKNVCKQMVANPEVEICYYARGIQIRVRGKVEMVEDLALKKMIVSMRPFYGEMSEEDYNDMAVFRLKGKAITWTMKDGDSTGKSIDL
jgi:pyridoxamine 5'-phosphate oxidase